MKNKYLTNKYLSIPRMYAYIEQYKYIDEGKTILEIGKGAGIFKYMVESSCYYQSFDIDPATEPDHLIDIRDWSKIKQFQDFFDIIFCCQVLEHMPFDEAKIAVENLMKLNAQTICLSFPDNRKSIKLHLLLAPDKYKKVYSIPFTGKKVDIQNHGQHYWELNSNNKKEIYTLFNEINNFNYIKEKDYRLFERAYQHFIILSKKNY